MLSRERTEPCRVYLHSRSRLTIELFIFFGRSWRTIEIPNGRNSNGKYLGGLFHNQWCSTAAQSQWRSISLNKRTSSVRSSARSTTLRNLDLNRTQRRSPETGCPSYKSDEPDVKPYTLRSRIRRLRRSVRITLTSRTRCSTEQRTPI